MFFLNVFSWFYNNLTYLMLFDFYNGRVRSAHGANVLTHRFLQHGIPKLYSHRFYNLVVYTMPRVQRRITNLYYTYPVPLHVLQRIIPAPLQPVHSIGDLFVKPRTESSLSSLFEVSTGVSLLPVELQNIQASPPAVAQDGHGFGSSGLTPWIIANPPKKMDVATTTTAWLVSSLPITEGSIKELVFVLIPSKSFFDFVSFFAEVDGTIEHLAIDDDNSIS